METKNRALKEQMKVEGSITELLTTINGVTKQDTKLIQSTNIRATREKNII
jgi:hypothetical protein